MCADVYETLSRTDFSGGLSASANPYQIKPNELWRLENLLFTEAGSLSTRDGAVTIDEGQFGTEAILSLYTYRMSTGVTHELAIRRSPSGQFLNLRDGVTPWPQLGTFATQYDLPIFRTLRNLAIIAAGYEPIPYWDGTTFGTLTADTGLGQVIPPGAKHMAVHKGSLWIFNTAATTNATDGPSSLRCSAVDNPNSWPLSFQTFLSNDDGQTGQGLATFTLAETGISPQGVLVAFKEYSTYTIAGLFGQPDFNIDKAKTDMGCIAPRTIEFLAPTRGVLRLTHRGFALFNGVNDEVISEGIRPFLFTQRSTADIQGLDWTQIHLSTSCQVQNPPLYVCACPLGPGPALQRVFVFDVLRQAWTILTFPHRFATMDERLRPGFQPDVVAGQQGGGRVYRLFAGDALDDTLPVHWLVRLPPIKGKSPAQRIFVRRTLVKARNLEAGQQVTARYVFGPMAQRQGPTVTVAKTSTATALSPGAGLEGQVVATLNFDVMRSGEVMHYELEGSGHIVIREIVQHGRTKPVSRPARL